MQSFSFGDSPAMADELLELVINGQKTATAWAAINGPKGSEVGEQMSVKDGQGKPRVTIETTELTRRSFQDVDESFAYAEGEGDRTLAYWRKVHRDYFTREGTFAEDMEVYCERFRVVEILQ